MKPLYRVRREQGDEYVVILIRTKRAVFYGTRRECFDWVERNGDNEWN